MHSWARLKQLLLEISKLMKTEYPNMKYALFPRAFCYVTDKNAKMTTRGIALQSMKHDNVQNLEEERDNPLGTHYLVHVGRGANLRSAVIQNLFLQHNQFL
jgi:hypothetical protein